MSSGAQAQVSLRGPQDAYLLSTEESTFWRAAYTRHTNAAIAELQQNFNMTPSYGANKILATITRNGDLVSCIYLHTKLQPISYPNNDFSIAPNRFAAYVDSFPHALIDSVVAKIGQTEFDTQYGYYMEMMEALMSPPQKLMGEQNFRYNTLEMRAIQSTFAQELWTPLKFWFCRFYEQALPYVALYWHDISLELSTRKLSELVQFAGGATIANTTVPANIDTLNLLVDYVYLDGPERDNFMAAKTESGAESEDDPSTYMEYVFDQVQFLGPNIVGVSGGSTAHNIRFNHPVQEILWACQQKSALDANDHFNWDGPTVAGTVAGLTRPTDCFKTARMSLNNNERVIPLAANYFRLVQPSQYHSRNPAADRRLYCYCFGIAPENMLDTGSVNFSRLDNATLTLEYLTTLPSPITTYIYARSKNIMKVQNGMAGRKYAA